MAELTPQERLQPSLLDRLTDLDPSSPDESRDARVLSLPRLREAVLRDLGWLLNSVHLQADQDLERYPQVQSSTVNFGIPDLAGVVLSGMDPRRMERAIAEAITRFEPRILPERLRVTAKKDEENMNRSALSFTIEGELWAQPLPQSLYLRTDLDLETGRFSVAESR